MFASVILCTYNRAHLLERALRSRACQTVTSEKFEIVVVDDGSTDGTAALCERAGRDLSNMRYVAMGKNLGLAAAGNRGLRSARGEFLLFIDDDCIAQEGWVECMTSSLERHPLAAGAIQSPVSNYIKLCHNISQFHPFMKRRTEGWTGSIAGANMGIRRLVLEELGGFDEKSKVPDMELMLRARLKGLRVHFAARAVVIHDPDRTSLATVLKNASEHASKTILLRNTYDSLLHTPFVLRSPGLILLGAPLIALMVTLKVYASNSGLVKYFWTAPLVYAQKLAWCWGAARGLRENQ
ncbi:MAG: glycosyltransferase [Candidatus Aminicenantes bacterium]|nr:glycosyltransferase [Candidatus Aminicenantes bacterium]